MIVSAPYNINSILIKNINKLDINTLKVVKISKPSDFKVGDVVCYCVKHNIYIDHKKTDLKYYLLLKGKILKSLIFGSKAVCCSMGRQL